MLFRSWLIYCYMIGAYLKIYSVNLSNKKIAKYFSIIYIVSFTLNCLIRNLGYIILGRIARPNLLINYVSPFTLILSVLIFLYFTNINIINSVLKKIVVYLSSMSFSVYIIHDQRMIFYMLLKNSFIPLLKYNLIALCCFSLGKCISLRRLCLLEVVCTPFKITNYKLLAVNQSCKRLAAHEQLIVLIQFE